MTIRSILPALCILLISCGKKSGVPPEYIPPAKMQLVFWDFIRADALTTLEHNNNNASPEALATNIKLQKQVFAMHQVTKEEFYRSLDYYNAHPALMRTLMDSVINKANRERPNITNTPNIPNTINPSLIK